MINFTKDNNLQNNRHCRGEYEHSMRYTIYASLITIIIALSMLLIVLAHISGKRIAQLESSNASMSLTVTNYKALYKSMADANTELIGQVNTLSSDLEVMEDNLTTALTAVEDYKLQITLNEASSVEYRNLTVFEPISEDDLNTWISNTVPAHSPFIGNAAVFLKASEETGLDPKYLVAHAGIESAWGTSHMAQTKGNYFGIGAFNSSPSSAYSFVSEGDNILELGILRGAIWIKEHYTDRGKTSLHDMLFKGSAYAQYDDGTPNTGWMYNIASVID